jgi:hypothetical protein
MRRGKQCPACGIGTAGRLLRRQAARRRQTAITRWPRELGPAELDAYGRGFHDGWQHGYVCGRDE